MTTHIMDQKAITELENWRDTFCRRYKCAPPEFWYPVGWMDFRDIYERDVFDTPNPIHSDWFRSLTTDASVLDLDTLQQVLDPDTVLPLLRFFQITLLERAWAADQAGVAVSVSIPLYFLSEGWTIGPTWNCERHYVAPTVAQLEARLAALKA